MIRGGEQVLLLFFFYVRRIRLPTLVSLSAHQKDILHRTLSDKATEMMKVLSKYKFSFQLGNGVTQTCDKK